MKHSYRIVTHKVAGSNDSEHYFIAQLEDIRIEIDGNNIAYSYPNKAFKDDTYTAAMLKAHDAFNIWIGNIKHRRTLIEI